MLPVPVTFDVVQLPPAGVAVNVTLPSSHTSVTVEVIDGAALTTKSAVVEQPLLFVKVIVVVPGDNGSTTPPALIVAKDVLLDDQPFMPNAVPLAERVTDDPPAVAVKVPDIVGFE
jgi:hypothetical protein